MARLPYILAVDIGSSTVKAGLYDGDANALPHTLASIPHEQRTAADGTHEEDAEAIQRVTEMAIDRALELAGEMRSRSRRWVRCYGEHDLGRGCAA